MTESTRAWIYRVLVAGSAVAVGYGIVTTEQAGLWLALAAAALIGNGLAAKNTSTSPDDGGQSYVPMLVVFVIGFILGALCYANGIIVGG